MRTLPSTIQPDSYLEVQGDALENLNKTAAFILDALKETLGPDVSYGPREVRALSDHIEKNRHKYNADQTLFNQMVWRYGAFLGKAIIESNPGKVSWADNKIDNYCLKVKTPNGGVSFSAPFAKAAKNISNGAEDSIFAFFLGVDSIVQNGFPQPNR